MIAPRTGQRFFWLSVPPRHWKTYTLRHIAAKHLERWPGQWVAWFSHTQQFANKQSRAIRRILRAGNIPLSEEVNRQDEWELLPAHGDEPGGMRAKGSGTGIAGEGFRLIIVDDPFPNREAAQSRVMREKIFDWLEDDVIPRLSPDGALLLVHTRWHEDDTIGRYKQRGWPGVNIQALAEADDPLGRELGEALLPEFRPREWLEAMRDENPIRFASLYQGHPRAKGAEVFQQNPLRFTELPKYRKVGTAYGLDLAYTAKTSADRSVCLKLQRFDDQPEIYVTDCVEARTDAPTFLALVDRMTRDNSGPIRWYTGGGGEKGVAAFAAEKIRNLDALPATTDKLVRAGPVSEAWNLGKIVLPDIDSPLYGDWVETMLDEVTSFSGLGDPHDDFVDALAAGFDALDDHIDYTLAAKTNENLCNNPALHSRFGPDARRPRQLFRGLNSRGF